jgi:hypothetical protein
MRGLGADVDGGDESLTLSEYPSMMEKICSCEMGPFVNERKVRIGRATSECCLLRPWQHLDEGHGGSGLAQKDAMHGEQNNADRARYPGRAGLVDDPSMMLFLATIPRGTLMTSG